MSSFYQATCVVCGETKNASNMALVTTPKGVYRACPGMCRAAIIYRDRGVTPK